MSTMISWPLRSNHNADFMPAVRKLIKQKYANKDRCQQALKHLEELESGQGDFERSFYVLKLACQSRSNRIVIIALDCIQKLVAYGYLQGTRLDPYEQTKGLLIDTIVEAVCNCFHGPATDDGVQLQIIKALLTLVTSPSCQVHESSLLLAIQTCFDIYLSSRNSTNQNTAKATLTQMFNCSFQKMESYQGPELDDYVVAQCLSHIVSQIDQDLPTYTKSQEFEPANILHYDAYIIFHALCKLSMRQVSEEHPLKLKLLSLQLILAILQNAGTVLKSSEIFLAAIKQCLCVALSKNGLSTNNEILNLSLSIFMCLLKDFKVHLKLQIEVFFKEIIIHIIESPSSSFDKRWMVLDALISICSDAQSIVDLFVNYDCDLNSTNIFERIVTVLSRIAQAKGQASNNDLAAKIRDRNLRIRGFECLVAVLKCMVDWSKDLYINPFLTTFKNRTNISKDNCITYSGKNNNTSFNIPSQQSTAPGETGKKIMECASGHNNNSNLQDMNSTKNFSDKNNLPSDVVPCCNGIQNLDITSNTINKTSTTTTKKQCGVTGDTSSANSNMISNNSININSGNASGLTQSGNNSNSVSSDLQSLSSLRDDPGQIEVTKMHKSIIEQGYDLFNRKPKRGLEFLQKHGYLGSDEAEIAKFLYTNNDKLDKTTQGEFIGDLQNKEIMYLFVNQMSFAGKDIVAALRHFLDHFRLPGEAQKIDRLMEKFAARYCETNPDNKLFHSADVAYILSYSIIILTTDLHSPSIKNKITKEQYIRMNQPTDDSKDKSLPEEFLSQIYDEIASSEIKVKGSVAKTNSSQGPPSGPVKWTDKLTSGNKQKRLLYNMELESMAETARILMESVSHVEAQFTLASHFEHVKPMFKIAWTPFLVAFSVGLQELDDDTITYLCLLGFRYALRIAGSFRMYNERDAFVQALARFTNLLTTSQNKSITLKEKNINTIKTLVMVAHSEGNYLGVSWLEIMRCISQLEYAQLLGANNQQVGGGNSVSAMPAASLTSSSSLSSSTNPSGEPSGNSAVINDSKQIIPMLNDLWSLQERFEQLRIITTTDGSTRKEVKLLSENLNSITSQSIFLAVDRIFTGSVLLDGDAIVDFVRALCQVSNEELATPHHQPRMFSLQKLVEISYYNMDRIRLQWSRIWSILGEHFNRVGCIPNEEVSIFALDSLRQLSMKFLEKGEFSNFRFQKDFLRPFEYIMKHNDSVSIRDMVIRCIYQMVSSQANNIRSGWKNIFNIIRMAVWDEEQTIVVLAYQAASDVMYQYPKLASLNEVIDELEYRQLVGSIYHSLTNLIQHELRPESRLTVKHLLLLIGDIYSITTVSCASTVARPASASVAQKTHKRRP